MIFQQVSSLFLCLLDKSLLKPVVRDVKIIVSEGVEKDVKKQRNMRKERKGRQRGSAQEDPSELPPDIG